MRGPRAELGLAILLCLLGACVVLAAASRTWVELTFTGSPVLPDEVVRLPGAELVPGVRALALVGLAGVVALLATRGTLRLLVGLLLAASGAAVVAVTVGLRGRLSAAINASEALRERGTVGFDGTPDHTAWLWACAAGGVVLLLAGLLVVLRGRRWAALSRRYESPAGRAQETADPTERSLWEALDRGEDPTGE